MRGRGLQGQMPRARRRPTPPRAQPFVREYSPDSIKLGARTRFFPVFQIASDTLTGRDFLPHNPYICTDRSYRRGIVEEYFPSRGLAWPRKAGVGSPPARGKPAPKPASAASIRF